MFFYIHLGFINYYCDSHFSLFFWRNTWVCKWTKFHKFLWYVSERKKFLIFHQREFFWFLFKWKIIFTFSFFFSVGEKGFVILQIVNIKHFYPIILLTLCLSFNMMEFHFISLGFFSLHKTCDFLYMRHLWRCLFGNKIIQAYK